MTKKEFFDLYNENEKLKNNLEKLETEIFKLETKYLTNAIGSAPITKDTEYYTSNKCERKRTTVKNSDRIFSKNYPNYNY